MVGLLFEQERPRPRKCDFCKRIGWGFSDENTCERIETWEWMGDYSRHFRTNTEAALNFAMLELARQTARGIKLRIDWSKFPGPIPPEFVTVSEPPEPAKRRGRRSSQKDGRVSFEKLKREVPIEVVAAKFTELRPAGRNFKGLCPFHEERTPSFHVWPDSGRWRCFGACATGGDVIALYQVALERGLI